jgi:hypothetical protein
MEDRVVKILFKDDYFFNFWDSGNNTFIQQEFEKRTSPTTFFFLVLK